jgi:predicted transcriptional regulator of viral defense system
VPVRDRQELRKSLAQIAAAQSGYFTAAQALRIGYSYPAQRYHAERGNWLRVDRGIFRLPEWPAGPHEDLVRWTLWSRERAIVSHDTALALHGLGDVNPASVHLTVPPGFRSRAPGVVLHVGIVPKEETEGHEGFRITTPVRTLIDVAEGDLELDQLTRAIGDALKRGITTRRALRARAESADPRAAFRVERALGDVGA